MVSGSVVRTKHHLCRVSFLLGHWESVVHPMNSTLHEGKSQSGKHVDPAMLGVRPSGSTSSGSVSASSPCSGVSSRLFRAMFPSWFAGVAYAAVAIGALVPAAIMSIAAANPFTRNIYRDLFRPRATPAEEAQVSKNRVASGEVRRLGARLRHSYRTHRAGCSLRSPISIYSLLRLV